MQRDTAIQPRHAIKYPAGRLSSRLRRVVVDPEESVALITNKGRLWKGNAGRIQLQTTFGEFGLAKDERVINASVVKAGLKLVLVTRSGMIKRTNVEDLNGRTEGNWAPMIRLEKVMTRWYWQGLPLTRRI